MRIIAVIIGIILAYSIDAQQLEAGIFTHPESKVLVCNAETKILPFGRVGMGLVTDLEYWQNMGYWKSKTGFRCGVGKVMITNYLIKDNDTYFYGVSIGVYFPNRYSY